MKKDTDKHSNDKDDIYSEFDYRADFEENSNPTEAAGNSGASGRKDDEEESEEEKRKSAFLILVKILFSGTMGWKELRRSHLKPEETAAGCFYPLAALVSVCRFADWFNKPDFSLTSTLTEAVAIFVSFFFSFFGVLIFSKWLFPEEIKDRTETPYFRQLVQYALSSLAVFWIPAEIIPVLEPLTAFLPLWTIFLITKGMRFLRIPHKYEVRSTVTLVGLTVGLPYLIHWLCGYIF